MRFEMKEVNLKSLAKELDLSKSTVSRALNDNYQISIETKKRVLKLAKEWNYQLNPYARSLRIKKSKTIAVIIPEIASNFFSLVINGIEDMARSRGYQLLIYITHESNANEIQYCNLLLNGRVDGVLMSMSGEVNDLTHIEALMEHHIPVVFFDRVCEEAKTVKIITNDYESAYMGTEHLIQRGVTKIAYLGISQTYSIGKNRLKGYLDALQNNQIGIKEEYIINCANNYDENYKKVEKLLSSADRPTGVFAAVEQHALLCYNVVNKLGLTIPGDIKVIGFSNLTIAHLLNPSLTTIAQPAFEIGREAAKALFESLLKNAAPLENTEITLKSVIVEGQSTFNAAQNL
jgi:LacI family transcriptional regulator